jgi:hypothetical protein
MSTFDAKFTCTILYNMNNWLLKFKIKINRSGLCF